MNRDYIPIETGWDNLISSSAAYIFCKIEEDGYTLVSEEFYACEIAEIVKTK